MFCAYPLLVAFLPKNIVMSSVASVYQCVRDCVETARRCVATLSLPFIREVVRVARDFPFVKGDIK
ncbi:hypothetical protein E2C01_064826 [Portunus trituberculatus]|uniref:Uncharacterized protein n=1 Tax=Portunus trituberculatus TaxID=210409 RepID=A0A5B7HPW3_PORTR|nr:hypothetical protein [Portunus trituberculatus]